MTTQEVYENLLRDAVSIYSKEGLKEKLESGEIDLLNKVVDGDVVNSMRPMLSEGYSLLYPL